MRTVATIAIVLACLVATPAIAQQKGKQHRVAAQTRDAVSPNQVIGKTFKISLADLPVPKATAAVSNRII